MRQRQVLFSVLRALGSGPDQLARVLLWEQIIIYAAALLIGTLLGLLASFLLIPSLILTSNIPGGSATSSLDLYALQLTPPAHMVIGPSFSLVLASLLLCGLTILFMYRATTRLLVAQTLRTNQD